MPDDLISTSTHMLMPILKVTYFMSKCSLKKISVLDSTEIVHYHLWPNSWTFLAVMLMQNVYLNDELQAA
jgi:hypothetical protein